MYIPHLNREDHPETLLAFMKEHAFATVVSAADHLPLASHIPVTVTETPRGVRIRGHFAKANEQWRSLGGSDTLVIFAGPHAYISPVHYDRWESVPTWNYLAVHASGRARPLSFDDEPETLAEILAELIGEHEPEYQARWDSLSARYRQGMLRGIVGFELIVDRLEGKMKLSQNKSRKEQARIVDALMRSDDPAAAATGDEMRRRLPAEAE
ncbi:MAG: FMN-binding negative transcriptional regulator [Trueperaceae bacterium]